MSNIILETLSKVEGITVGTISSSLLTSTFSSPSPNAWTIGMTGFSESSPSIGSVSRSPGLLLGDEQGLNKSNSWASNMSGVSGIRDVGGVLGGVVEYMGGGVREGGNRTPVVWPGEFSYAVEDELPVYLRVTTLVFLLFIFVVGTVGNSMVIIVIHCSRDMRTSTNIFLLNLSVADLLVLLICTPTCIMEVFYDPEMWMLGAAMCKLVSLLEVTVAHASVLTILAISFERYYAICCPLRANYVCTKTRAFTICLTTWFAAGIITSPMYLMVKYHVEDGTPKCDIVTASFWADVYTVSSNVIFFLLPFIILLVTYGLIARNLSSDRSRLSQSHTRHSTRARQQVIMMLGTVVFTFFLCLLPFRVLTLYIVFGDQEPFANIEIYYNILYFSRIMFYLNSALNPILYNIMSSKFRNGFLFLCSRKRRRLYRFQRRGTFHTMTTTSTASTTSNLPNNFIHTAIPVQAVVTDRRTCRLGGGNHNNFGFNKPCCGCHCHHHHHHVHHHQDLSGLTHIWNGSLGRAVAGLKSGALTPNMGLASPTTVVNRDGFSFSLNNIYCQNCIDSGALSTTTWEFSNAANQNTGESKSQVIPPGHSKCVCYYGGVRGHGGSTKSHNPLGGHNCINLACPQCIKKEEKVEDLMFWKDEGRDNESISKDGQKFCVRMAMKSNCYACTYSSLNGPSLTETIL